MTSVIEGTMRILMYHQITAAEPQEVHGVSAHQFARQMEWLRQSGYQTAPLNSVVASTSTGSVFSPKSVVLTFDDGYEDTYTRAFPMLLEYGYSASVFLVAGMMGRTSAWQEGELASTRLMSWGQAREMARKGVAFGSHTLTHADLPKLALSDVSEELCKSRQAIEQELGMPVTTLAYPYGRENAAVRRLVRDSGYRSACAYRPYYFGGAGKDDYRLQRIGILATDTLAGFEQKVKGALSLRMVWWNRLLRSRARDALAMAGLRNRWW